MISVRCLTMSVAICALALPAAAEDLEFDLNNHSGGALTEFYASPHNVNNWEEDILGQDVLMDGESTRITIADGRSQCDYDLKMVFKDGTDMNDSVNLCDTGSYTINH